MPIAEKMEPKRIDVDPETQAILLRTLEDLPPKSWLGEHLTRDQLDFFADLRMVNIKLLILFEDYFNGKDSSKRNWGDKKRMKLIELERDYYLSFYQLLKRGWVYIEPLTELLGKLAPRSPGDALVKAIEINCAVSFKTCFTYSTFPKSQVYKLYREGEKIRELLLSKQQLSHSEENRVKRFTTKLKNVRKPYESFLMFEGFLISVCSDAAENDPVIQRALGNFLDQADLGRKALIRRLPEAEGHAWDGKGNKLKSTKVGGIYR